MTLKKRMQASTPILNPKVNSASKSKMRDMTVEEARKSARKTVKRYGAALKELARR